ncbi:MAG: mannitol dehydrogenase family protein [Lachnospiraceae bacterium]|nr:mannitol dehydrogenase family protein [Lachnospiraceae bacterium]
MKLLELQNGVSGEWEEKGYQLPKYDRETVKRATKKAPAWVHFGAGNIFRAFPAERLQQILDEGTYDKGVIVAESFDHEIITKAYKPYDGLSLSVVLKANGTIEKIVVGSVVESLVADPEYKEDYDRLTEIFENPSLQMVSFTITEKGYSLVNGKGEKLPGVEEGMQAGPGVQSHLMGRIATLCYSRFEKGAAPLALASMDNCSHNGDKLKAGVMAYVEAWEKAGKVGADFATYMKEKVSFPWSMIDKITPRPDENVQAMLEKDGFEDTELIITNRNTYTAPFVNSEETGYLVIEDDFPNGRPPLEKAGIVFTDRETVDKVEKMKVCTCLNPLHTALAIYGCMLGHTSIHDEMEDTELCSLITKMCYEEGMPVVVNPGVIDPKDFADAVLTLRLPNPFMPDTPQRIACDTSQKLPIRFGETIKAYQKKENLNAGELTLIPLVLAGWCRYLLGVDDEGKAFEQSPDPRLEEVKAHVKAVTLGNTDNVHQALEPILSDNSLFAVNLYEAGLGKKVEEMFAELTAGPGAIRSTLKKYLA